MNKDERAVRYEQFDFFRIWFEELDLNLSRAKQENNQFKLKFVEDCYESAQSYYAAIESWQIVFLLLEEIEEEGYRRLNEVEKHLDKILDTDGFRKQNLGYINRSFVIEAWSTFEINLYELVRNHFDKTEIDHFFLTEYRRIKKQLSTSQVSEADDQKLKDQFQVKEVSRLTVPYLLDRVFDKCNNYKGDEKADKIFLKSLGRFRNLMHNGFTNYSEEFKVSYRGYTILTKKSGYPKLISNDGKPIRDVKAYPALLDEMIAIWSKITDSIVKG